jgi:hypothetical protein
VTKSHESIENDKTMVKRKDYRQTQNTEHKILNTENWKIDHQEPQRKQSMAIKMS